MWKVQTAVYLLSRMYVSMLRIAAILTKGMTNEGLGAGQLHYRIVCQREEAKCIENWARFCLRLSGKNGFSCTGLHEIQIHPPALREDQYRNFTKMGLEIRRVTLYVDRYICYLQFG